jgi:hypothetical protein
VADLTSEEMAALRVPLAALPGFGPVGLSLWNERDGLRGTVVETDMGLAVFCMTEGDGHLHDRDDAWEYDLADASTRDRIARWVAGRAGLTLGSTAPDWGWCPPVMTWRLSAERGEWDAPQALFDDAFWDIHLGDTRRLPDGSGYADAKALGMAAVHVGSRS